MTVERSSSINVVSAAGGLCFVVVGVLLLLERGGFVEMREVVRLWPLALVVLGTAVAWQASRGASDGVGTGASMLIWIAILGMFSSQVVDRRVEDSSVPAEGRVSAFAVLGADRGAAFQGTLRGGSSTAILGGVNIDLRSASLAPGETAVVDVFNLLGGTDIRVPESWAVSIETTTVLGGSNDRRGRGEERPDEKETQSATPPDTPVAPAVDVAAASTDVAPPRLIVQGVVIMGGLSIKQ